MLSRDQNEKGVLPVNTRRVCLQDVLYHPHFDEVAILPTTVNTA